MSALGPLHSKVSWTSSERAKQSFPCWSSTWHLPAHPAVKQWLYTQRPPKSHQRSETPLRFHVAGVYIHLIHFELDCFDSSAKTPFPVAPANSHDSGATTSDFRKSVSSTPSYQRHLKNEKGQEIKALQPTPPALGSEAGIEERGALMKHHFLLHGQRYSWPQHLVPNCL